MSIIEQAKKLDWLKWRLTELANQDADDIESNEIEILGEDEQGNEGFCTAKITGIAEDAHSMIESLIKQLEQYKQVVELANDAFSHSYWGSFSELVEALNQLNEVK